MEPLLPLVAMAVGLSVAYLVNSFRRQARMRAWDAAARASGLRDVRSGAGMLFEGEALEGEAEGLHVRLESYRRGRSESGTRIVVSGLGHGIGGLSLRRESLGTAFEKNVVGEREIEIGDRAFDERFYIRGQAQMAWAVLGPQVRGPLSDLLLGQVDAGPAGRAPVSASLADGRLEVKVRHSPFAGESLDRLPAILGSVLRIARSLVVGDDIARRIADNIEHEPSDGVRLRALVLLAREFPEHPATVERLRAALLDPADEVQLRAALALDAEGRDTLLRLVTRPADDACVARAIGALGARLPHELAESTLRRALAAGPACRETTLACLEHLRQFGRPDDEALLIGALGPEDDAVAEASARALGRIGGVAAVEPLLKASHSGRRGVYRQAVAEIQSRLPGAGAGQLSLAADETGALSLADADPGRLSIVGEEPRAVPLPTARQRE